MRAAVFAVEQIGVDGDGSVTDIQKEQFIGQREKILAGIFEYRNHVSIQQSAMVEFGKPLRRHIFAHVQLGCDFFRTGQNIFFTVDVQIAEIGEDSKSLGLEFPLPDIIWKRETASLRITLIGKQIDLCTPPSI